MRSIRCWRASRPASGVAPDALEAADGYIRVIAEPGKRMAWKEAAAKIGPTPVSVTADRDKPGDQAPLFTANVGGINMAEVSVDTETGIVRIEEMVAVQDVGLVVSHKTCESQVLRRDDHGRLQRALRRADLRRSDRAGCSIRTSSSTSWRGSVTSVGCASI